MVTVSPVLERVDDFERFLGETMDDDAAYATLRQSETIGRPIGDAAWLEALEAQTGRAIVPRKRGPKPKQAQT